MAAVKRKQAVEMGFSPDRRKRKRQHRKAAKALIDGGTLLNATAPRGSTPWVVAQWHLAQARRLG
jgi:hypothetical protein